MSGRPYPAPGWVYILTNRSMPGLVKIGMTGRTPSLRIAELTRASGVPSPFELAWSAPVSDCAWVEAAVHRMLADRRVSAGREFFHADVTLACKTIVAIGVTKPAIPAWLPASMARAMGMVEHLAPAL